MKYLPTSQEALCKPMALMSTPGALQLPLLFFRSCGFIEILYVKLLIKIDIKRDWEDGRN